MELKIFILCLLALTVTAQSGPSEEHVLIPCMNDNFCKKFDQRALCNNGSCICISSSGKWELCPFVQDAIVGAKPRGSDLSCDRDDDCRYINNTHCLPIHVGDNSIKVCQCDAHMVMSANSTQCLKIAVGPESECSESTQCTAGLGNFSECLGGKCRCQANYHYVGDAKDHCVPNKGYGAKCTREEQSCYQPNPDATKNVLGCSSKGVCKCIKSYSFIDGLCRSSGASQMIPQVLIVTVLIAAATWLF